MYLIAVAEELVDKLKTEKGLCTRQALYMLGFDIKKRYSVRKQDMRVSDRPYMIMRDCRVYQGQIRVIEDIFNKDRNKYAKVYHPMIDIYRQYEVLSDIKYCESLEMSGEQVNINTIGNEHYESENRKVRKKRKMF